MGLLLKLCACVEVHFNHSLVFYPCLYLIVDLMSISSFNKCTFWKVPPPQIKQPHNYDMGWHGTNILNKTFSKEYWDRITKKCLTVYTFMQTCKRLSAFLYAIPFSFRKEMPENSPPIVLSWYSWNCPLTKRSTKLDLPTADSPSSTSLNWQILLACDWPFGLVAPLLVMAWIPRAACAPADAKAYQPLTRSWEHKGRMAWNRRTASSKNSK